MVLPRGSGHRSRCVGAGAKKGAHEARNDLSPPCSKASEKPGNTSRWTRPTARGVGYVRVAAASQTAARSSVDIQAAKIRARARSEGIDLVGIIEDNGESAHDLKRPGLTKLFSILGSQPIRLVIVADLSRLARNLADLCHLLRRFVRRQVALIAVEEALDTRTSQGRRELRALFRLSEWWR